MTEKQYDPFAGMSPTRRDSPPWDGPEAYTEGGGVTCSLLSRYITCKERFRLYAVEGWRSQDSFDHRLEFGNMWHLCEEVYGDGGDWEASLKDYARSLCMKYGHHQEQIEKWWNVCKRQFPIYLKFCDDTGADRDRRPLMREAVFRVPYPLRSGRTVFLRGKWDGLDLVGRGRTAVPYLVEHKTKGDIDETLIQRRLRFDLQTMTYFVALSVWQGLDDAEPPRTAAASSKPPAGVLYNVVRRPLSGGKGTVTRHKATQGSKCPKCKGTGKAEAYHVRCPKCGGLGRVGAKPEEDAADYYARVMSYVEEDPASYFMRWKVGVSSSDARLFVETCLDPLLENVTDDYEWWTHCLRNGVDQFNYTARAKKFPEHVSRPFRHPYGVDNAIDAGYTTDLDFYLETGSNAGLRRVDTVFPELTAR